MGRERERERERESLTRVITKGGVGGCGGIEVATATTTVGHPSKIRVQPVQWRFSNTRSVEGGGKEEGRKRDGGYRSVGDSQLSLYICPAFCTVFLSLTFNISLSPPLSTSFPTDSLIWCTSVDSDEVSKGIIITAGA